jgi:hypothetical protein
MNADDDKPTTPIENPGSPPQGTPPVVFAECSTSVGWGGRTLYLKEGQVWDARDPFVKARPEFFMAVPRVLCTTVDPSTLNMAIGDVEAAEKPKAGKPRTTDASTARKPRSTRG